jgi:hypothetical protein
MASSLLDRCVQVFTCNLEDNTRERMAMVLRYLADELTWESSLEDEGHYDSTAAFIRQALLGEANNK